MKNYNIAIDGPAGAGKSTVARAVAEKLAFIYVDTGAMYRAMGLYLNEQKVEPSDGSQVKKIAAGADISITYVDGKQQVFLNGRNVNNQIRTEEAGKLASAYSGYLVVRKALVELQQKLAASNSVVMDGRDIGTKVLPLAELKIYLTAGTKERALRRFAELETKGVSCSIDEIEQDIIKRDYQDMNREESPLCQAENAIFTDCSTMTAAEVTEYIVKLFYEKTDYLQNKKQQ